MDPDQMEKDRRLGLQKEDVLARYRSVLLSCAQAARHDPETWRFAIERLKFFAVIHGISADEHDAAVLAAGVDPAILVDRHGNALADMARAREALPRQSAGILVTPLPERSAGWRTKLMRPLPSWQSVLAIIAMVLIAVGLVMVLL
jgi:hypothetical protein